MEKVNLSEKLASFSDHWNPRIVGEVNHTQIKLAKLKGEFDWHFHETEDEMFLVVKGSLLIRFRDREVTLQEGEFCIVPKGVEHQPVATEEVQVMLIEPNTTLNTGNVQSERTRANLERI